MRAHLLKERPHAEAQHIWAMRLAGLRCHQRRHAPRRLPVDVLQQLLRHALPGQSALRTMIGLGTQPSRIVDGSLLHAFCRAYTPVGCMPVAVTLRDTAGNKLPDEQALPSTIPDQILGKPCLHRVHSRLQVIAATLGICLPWKRMEVMESWRSVKCTRWSLGSCMAALALASSCWTPASVLALSACHTQLLILLKHFQSHCMPLPPPKNLRCSLVAGAPATRELAHDFLTRHEADKNPLMIFSWVPVDVGGEESNVAHP